MPENNDEEIFKGICEVCKEKSVEEADKYASILRLLVYFQKDYEEQTGDVAPGNDYYAGQLIMIVEQAREALK